MKISVVTVLVGFVMVILEQSVNAQFPFGGGDIPGMGNLMHGMNTMMAQLQSMNMRLQSEAQARQQYIQSLLPDLQPGEGREFDNGAIRGYAYRSRDGSYSYNIIAGGQSHGYIYHSGPDGVFERRW